MNNVVDVEEALMIRVYHVQLVPSHVFPVIHSKQYQIESNTEQQFNKIRGVMIQLRNT